MARLLSGLWTGALLALTAILLAVAAAPAFGYRATVLTGSSMEPTYDGGGMVVVRDVDPEDIDAGDVITYVNHNDGLTTHRVVSPHELDSGLHFRTQGDANTTPDVDLTSADAVVGVVVADVSWAAPLLTIFTGSRARLLVPGVLAMWLVMAELRDIRRWRREEREAPEPAVEPHVEPHVEAAPEEAPMAGPVAAPVAQQSAAPAPAPGPHGMIPIIPVGGPTPPPGYAPIVVWMPWPPQLVWPVAPGEAVPAAAGDVPDTVPTWLQPVAGAAQPQPAPVAVPPAASRPAPVLAATEPDGVTERDAAVAWDAPLFGEAVVAPSVDSEQPLFASWRAASEEAGSIATLAPAPSPPRPSPHGLADELTDTPLFANHTGPEPGPPLFDQPPVAPLFDQPPTLPTVEGPLVDVQDPQLAPKRPRRSRLARRLVGSMLVVVSFGLGAMSAVALLVDSDPVAVSAVTTLTLATPANINAVASCSGLTPRVTVTWNDIADEGGYDVLRRTGTSGPFSTVGSVAANVTSYVNTPVSLNTTYQYTIRAKRQS